MDTKSRIKELMDERGWTIYELAKRSGLAHTTISNMWKRNTEPTIPSLRAICNGFGITLSQFFAEGDMVELTPEQKAFFTRWAVLSAEQKEMLMNLVNSMNKPYSQIKIGPKALLLPILSASYVASTFQQVFDDHPIPEEEI